MLILRFPIFHANETEFKNIHQAVDELKALPKWDKTKYYTAGPEYGIILSTETGNHVEMSDLPDHVKTFIHQFSKGYTSIF